MSEESAPKDSGITSDDDINHRTAYIETVPTKKPKGVKVDTYRNQSREVKVRGSKS